MAESAGIIDRTFAPLRRVLFGVSVRSSATSLTDAGLEKVRETIAACLDAKGGEVSARARAAELGRLYLTLDADGRARFLKLLASDYGVDHDRLDTAITAYQKSGSSAARQAAERRLRHALVPRRVALLTQFNALPQGVKFLVDMRSELLPLTRKHAELKALDNDLKELLVSWFDIGFLDLQRITWDSPASLLEKLIAYEAVHEIRSWSDLKNRLDSDRRCFAFFHPRMPDEPLIFVEVALVRGMADNVAHLLDEEAPDEDILGADTAIFYSISNAQDGLAGVSFGDFLIKKVVDELRKELPQLKTFATLSPVPGFRSWLTRAIEEGQSGLWTAAEERRLNTLALEKSAGASIQRLLERADWPEDQAVCEALQPVLMRACAKYLLTEKRDQQAADRVEHFHLSNGARLERINWLADPSKPGLRQSAGMMVNYLYRLNDIEKNHGAYTTTGKVTANTAVVRQSKA